MSDKDTADTSARAELYFAAHPRSPSAVRRPKLSKHSGSWVALLGNNVANGIVGRGMTVESALRAFDVQYSNALRPLSGVTSDRVAA